MDIYAFSKIKEITYKETAEILEEEKENFEEELYNKKLELGITEETEINAISEETEDWASAEAAEATLSGMFNVKDDINESINYSTGGLVLENTAAIIPGRNGLDLKIKFKYDSSVNLNENGIYNLKTGAEFIFSEDSIEMAKRVNKPIKLKTENGGVYSLKDGYYWVAKYYPGLDPYIYNDENAEAEGSKYKLEYRDTEIKEYFDSLGRLVEKRDKFGNKIQIKRNGNTTEITDTIGRKTIITNDSSKTEVVLPNKNKITYTNENGKLTKRQKRKYSHIYI